MPFMPQAEVCNWSTAGGVAPEVAGTRRRRRRPWDKRAFLAAAMSDCLLDCRGVGAGQEDRHVTGASWLRNLQEHHVGLIMPVRFYESMRAPVILNQRPH